MRGFENGFDRKPVLWEYGVVKTTLEVPDELMRRVKMRAVQRNQKLKDAVAQLLEAGMAAAAPAVVPVRPPKPVRLRSRTNQSQGKPKPLNWPKYREAVRVFEMTTL